MLSYHFLAMPLRKRNRNNIYSQIYKGNYLYLLNVLIYRIFPLIKFTLRLRNQFPISGSSRIIKKVAIGTKTIPIAVAK